MAKPWDDIGALAKDPDFFPPSRTTTDQAGVQRTIEAFYLKEKKKNYRSKLRLSKEEHIKYLKRGLRRLGAAYQCLDASRPWLCYWILNALDLLGGLPSEEELDNVVTFLSKCQNPSGGFGGGPMQFSHFATTYAAVNACVIVGTERAYEMIDRAGIYRFLLKMKNPVDGSFSIHEGGEYDVRATYCALSVASILNLLTPEITKNCGEFIAACQSYEGGMGGEPGNEAHGGYTFCALSAINILGEAHKINFRRLLEWAVDRQMKYEGGFQGRTNKLVDSCYSFWQGGIFPQFDSMIREIYQKPTITDLRSSNSFRRPSSSSSSNASGSEVEEVDSDREEELLEEGTWLFDQYALQDYILICCQERGGGLKDKPGKGRDFYHTCYALSGLSIAQNNSPGFQPSIALNDNHLRPLNPIYGITIDKVEKAIAYFKTKPSPPPL